MHRIGTLCHDVALVLSHLDLSFSSLDWSLINGAHFRNQHHREFVSSERVSTTGSCSQRGLLNHGAAVKWCWCRKVLICTQTRAANSSSSRRIPVWSIEGSTFLDRDNLFAGVLRSQSGCREFFFRTRLLV